MIDGPSNVLPGPGMIPNNQPQVKAELHILFLSDGNLSVTGNLENRLLAYGMLEIAKDVVRQFQEKAEQRIMQAPPGLIIPRA